MEMAELGSLAENVSAESIPITLCALSDAATKTVVATVYVIVLLLGLVSNISVIIKNTSTAMNVPKRSQQQNKAVLYFMTNISVSDLILLICSIPVQLWSIFNGRRWPFGQLACSLVIAPGVHSTLVSALSVSSFAIVRYRKVVYHETPKRIHFLLVTLGIWTLSAVLALPLGLVSKVEVDQRSFNGSLQYTCGEQWPKEGGAYLKMAYGLGIASIQYGLTLAVTVFCYGKIRRILIHSMNRTYYRASCSLTVFTEKEMKKRQGRNRKLTVMVGVFLISWLPINLYIILMDFNLFPSSLRCYQLKIFWACHMIAMQSTIYNVYFNSMFQKGHTSRQARHESMELTPTVGKSNKNTSLVPNVDGFTRRNSSWLSFL